MRLLRLLLRAVRRLLGLRAGRTDRRRSCRRGNGPDTADISAGTVLSGPCCVIDGDTIVIRRTRIRIAGIDAPELDHPWGRKAKRAVIDMCRGQVVHARLTGESSHGRIVATCHLPDGRDIAAELVRQGLALDWPKFSGGRYRHLEPRGVRRRLWRADARQRGRLRI